MMYEERVGATPLASMRPIVVLRLLRLFALVAPLERFRPLYEDGPDQEGHPKDESSVYQRDGHTRYGAYAV